MQTGKLRVETEGKGASHGPGWHHLEKQGHNFSMSEPIGENSRCHSSAPGESKFQPSPWLSLDQEAWESQLPVSTGMEDLGLEAKTRFGAGGGMCAGPSPFC